MVRVDIEDILFGRSGGYSGEATPVPIPNTVVKLLSADDTWGATPWEIRTSQVLQKTPQIAEFFRACSIPFFL